MVHRWMLTALFTLLPFILPAQSASDVPVPPQAQDQGLTQTVIMLVIFGAFFYLILWRPEQKRRKELEQQRSTLSKGDEVIAMGIIGTVVSMDEESVILKMVDGNTRIKFVKAAISEVIRSNQGEGKD